MTDELTPVYAQDAEGNWHSLYLQDPRNQIPPPAFCGMVVGLQTVEELPEGAEVDHSCKPTKAEKTAAKEVVTPTPDVP